MLNFNSMESVSPYSLVGGSVPINNNISFPTPSTSLSAISTTATSTASTTSCHQQQLAINYMNNAEKHSMHWPNNNIVGSNNGLPLPIPNHKNYCHPNGQDGHTISGETYLSQKDSENVKRFSVNNLLQLANNGRMLTTDRLTGTLKEKT